MSIDTKTSPLVIIAFAAGDPDFIQHWVQQGYLPTLGALLQRGCWGRLAGREQLSEHAHGENDRRDGPKLKSDQGGCVPREHPGEPFQAEPKQCLGDTQSPQVETEANFHSL